MAHRGGRNAPADNPGPAHCQVRLAGGPQRCSAILYETVIPPDERRQLGEYYTPDWLARAIVREVVTDPLDQYVLDPACGSGTFVAEAVTHFIEAANATALDSKDVLEWLRFSVAGIDVHPVAVHLARAAWVLAAQPAIKAAVEDGFAANITVPVYLGDALQLRFRTGDMFAEHNVTVQVEDEENTELVFPVSLVEQAETFDALMSDVAEAIEKGDDPALALRHLRLGSERMSQRYLRKLNNSLLQKISSTISCCAPNRTHLSLAPLLWGVLFKNHLSWEIATTALHGAICHLPSHTIGLICNQTATALLRCPRTGKEAGSCLIHSEPARRQSPGEPERPTPCSTQP